MDAATTSIRQFLLEAQRRFGSHAVAFISPAHDPFHFHCDTPDARDVKEMLHGIADAFLTQVRDRAGAEANAPLVRNKVRYENGGPLIGRFLVAPVPDAGGELAGILLVLRLMSAAEFNKEDIGQGARLSRELTRQLSLPPDSLTGLVTRTGMDGLVEWRLNAPGEQTESSVLYGNIDQLHAINDMLGFETGDRAIGVVANTLTAALAHADAMVSRLSGDRFVVLLPHCRLFEAESVASRLREAVQATPLMVGDDKLPLSISFGAAPLSTGKRNFDHALAAAEVACKSAKDRGRNRVETYQVSDTSIIRRRDDSSMIGGLRSALEQGRYQIFGQPIASLLTPESVHRYEMLLRIVDEQGKLLTASNFMSSAARYQLLPQIDRRVIADVLDHLRAASARTGFKPLHVSINLSGPTLGDPTFADWLLSRLDASGVDGHWLTFELTEDTAIGNLEQTQLLMSSLGGRGCRFALDDFGTGLSSLTHLKNLQFASLKIDGSFIRDILRDERSRSLVRAIAQLADAMGMQTVAEYVETPEICMRLIELEVQFGQGYAIGKPRPLNAILAPAAGLLHAS